MSGTHKYTWEKRQIDIPDVHSRDYNKKTVVNLKGHQSSGELWCPFKLSSSFFVLISRMGVKNVNLSFSQVYLCDPDISLFYQNTASINENKQSRKHQKNCKGTRTLVPFQVDNWLFIVISRMDIRNINLSFSPSVFMCS